MVGSGMNKDEGESKMGPKVNFFSRILPFGYFSYKIIGMEYPEEKGETKTPRYIEPVTTNIEKTEIRYNEGRTFSVPKTTA